jgi:hypothetical protein
VLLGIFTNSIQVRKDLDAVPFSDEPDENKFFISPMLGAEWRPAILYLRRS